MTDYQQFLAKKIQSVQYHGFDVDRSVIHPKLYPFQREVVKWALKLGKAAHDLRAALYTLREHPESSIAHRAAALMEAEFEEARVSLREAEALYAQMDADRLGEEVEA